MNSIYAVSFERGGEIEIPQNLKGVVGNQRINLFLDEKYFLSVEIRNWIADIIKEQFNKPMLKVYIKNEKLNRIFSLGDKKE